MAVQTPEYRALAEVRYRIRRFLNFSEGAARSAGLEPQQHQLLLAVRGLPEGVDPTIGRIAERLQIQHHSAVELVNRCVEKDLVKKRTGARDRREVVLAITPRGRRLLEKLAVAHRSELRKEAPALRAALNDLLAADPAPVESYA